MFRRCLVASLFAVALAWGSVDPVLAAPFYPQNVLGYDFDANVLPPYVGDLQVLERYKGLAEAGDAKAMLALASCYCATIQKDKGLTVNVPLGLSYYRRAAETKDPAGLYALGVILSLGWYGAPADPARGLALLAEAASRGSGEAAARAGYAYELGLGASVDLVKAAGLYKQAAGNGSLLGMGSYATCLEEGKGIPRNEPEALRWYAAVAEARNVNFYGGRCLSRMGRMVLDGRGCKADPAKALAYFKQAARRSDAEGAYLAGQCFDRGQGAARDATSAATYYYEAIRVGSWPAQVALAKLYEKGQGVELHAGEAFRLTSLAAANEAPAAWLQLADYHLRGVGTPKAPAKAFTLLARAKLAGVAAAAEPLAKLQDELPANELGAAAAEVAQWLEARTNGSQTKPTYDATGKALRAAYWDWYELAAKNLDTGAMVKLATAYAIGRDLSRDPRQQKKWSLLAYKLGDQQAGPVLVSACMLAGIGDAVPELGELAQRGVRGAAFELGLGLRNGTNGVSPDKAKAFQFFNLAASQGEAMAFLFCADMIATGEGIGKDMKVAKSWYERAATFDNSVAQYKLGQLTEQALDGQVEAYMWYGLAAVRHPGAREALAKLEARLKPDEVVTGKARMAAWRQAHPVPKGPRLVP